MNYTNESIQDGAARERAVDVAVAADVAAEPASSGAAPARDAEPHRPLRKKPRQRTTERGLPADADLAKLARVFLDQQHQHWPALVQSELLPRVDDVKIERMIADFKDRHVNGAQSGSAPAAAQHHMALGAGYLRYSCDNSNPRSLDDQLVNVLKKARSQDRFIPWQLLFADASVTGLDASRQGYCSLKATLCQASRVDTVYIDEFSRAGRDSIEWFRLASFAKKLNKNVVGATDNFELNSPTGEMMLHVYSMLSRLFVAQLRDKVRRGMNGAARRMTSVGRPPLGYGLAPKRDEHGRPLMGEGGKPVNEWEIHAPTMRHVMEAAEDFANHRKSCAQIARTFNRLQVDGSDGWRPCSIRRLLANPVYIGVVIFNRTRNEHDPETHKRTTIENPRSEWQVVVAPHLRAWSDELWKKVRRRAGAAKRRRRERGPAGGRNADSPTTLLSGTLICACGKELKLVRSGKHAAMGCYDAREELNGCTMRTVKANAIVEETLLAYVRQHVLTDVRVGELVARANAALVAQASLPRQDPAHVNAALKHATQQRDKLVRLMLGEESDEFLQSIKEQIRTLEKEIARLNAELRQIHRHNEPPPTPLTEPDVVKYLGEIRLLLSQEPAAAGVALRKVTGQITVHDERHLDKKGGKWIMSFAPKLLPLLREQAEAGRDPASPTLRNPHMAGSDMPDRVTIVVDKRQSVQERLAPQVARLRGQIDSETGVPYTLPKIARLLGPT